MSEKVKHGGVSLRKIFAAGVLTTVGSWYMPPDYENKIFQNFIDRIGSYGKIEFLAIFRVASNLVSVSV